VGHFDKMAAVGSKGRGPVCPGPAVDRRVARAVEAPSADLRFVQDPSVAGHAVTGDADFHLSRHAFRSVHLISPGVIAPVCSGRAVQQLCFPAALASWRPEAIAVDPDRWWRGAAPLLYYWFFLERPKDDLLEFVPIEDRI